MGRPAATALVDDIVQARRLAHAVGLVLTGCARLEENPLTFRVRAPDEDRDPRLVSLARDGYRIGLLNAHVSTGDLREFAGRCPPEILTAARALLEAVDRSRHARMEGFRHGDT